MAPPKTTVDRLALVHGLADGKSVRQLASELHASRATLARLIASTEIQTALSVEREKRAMLANATIEQHVAHITGRMAAAASGEWSPDATQLRIAGIFLGWWPSTGPTSALIGSDAAPGGSDAGHIPPGTPIIVQVVQATKVESAE